MGSGYSIAQLLLRDGDGFCIVRYGSGEEEVVQMQETTHLVSQTMVRAPAVALPLPDYNSLSHSYTCPFACQTCVLTVPRSIPRTRLPGMYDVLCALVAACARL